MRSRTIREGSVGLLIIAGLVVVGGLILWIRGLNLGQRSYQAKVEFESVAGMQPGAPVRYRGVVVGRIKNVRPEANAAEVNIEIARASFVIPSDVIVEANQVGLIGETSIDIVPLSELPPEATEMSPLSPNCDRSLIVCDGAVLQGQVGVSYDTLIRTTARLAARFDDPEIVNEIKALVSNTSDAAEGVAVLTDEIVSLSESLETELTSLSRSASNTADSVSQAVNQFGITATQINSLLSENRTALVDILNQLDLASDGVQRIVNTLAPAIEEGDLIENLSILSANAAAASTNLRDLSNSVLSSENILLIQQTLDSAHATFQNAQKITADLDELTGDPEFRRNVRDLVDGLNGLVSSTQQLQQQVQVAQVLGYASRYPVGSSSFTPQVPASNRPQTRNYRLLESDQRVRPLEQLPPDPPNRPTSQAE
jgi:phospholipid/cholesterol/gamma-HCH transport system substrate-binding protein